MAKKSNKKGFTLVELVIVVAILAVLATVAIPAITPLTTDAKANVDAVNAKTIESVLKLAVVEASKDSSTEVELDVQQVYNAIYEANLNIKSSSFAFKKNSCFPIKFSYYVTLFNLCSIFYKDIAFNASTNKVKNSLCYVYTA